MRTDVDERLAKAERRLEVSRLGWLPHPGVGGLRCDDVVVARQQQRPTTVSTSTTGSNAGWSQGSSTANPVSAGERASCSRLVSPLAIAPFRQGFYSQHPRRSTRI